MIVVAHYVAPSPIAGLGLFTSTALAAGETIYRFDPRFTFVLSNAEVQAMPAPAQARIANYVYRGKGAHRLAEASYYCADDSRFMNHSATPNTRWVEETESYVTTEAVAAHGELTCDYGEFSEPGDCCFSFAAL